MSRRQPSPFAEGCMTVLIVVGYLSMIVCFVWSAIVHWGKSWGGSDSSLFCAGCLIVLPVALLLRKRK